MKNIFKKKNYITKEQFNEYKKGIRIEIDNLEKEIDRLSRIIKNTSGHAAGFDVYTDVSKTKIYGGLLRNFEYYLRVYVNGEEHVIKLNEDVGKIDENTKYIEWANGSDIVTIQFVANKFAFEDICNKYRFVIDLKNDSYIQTEYIEMNYEP